MSFELQPGTNAGRRFTETAEGLIATLRSRSAASDQQSIVCAENFEDLQRTGIAAAFVPEALGGFGLESVHDWLTGISRLARGDGSTAIAINMHLGVSRGMALAFDRLQKHDQPLESVAAPLIAIASGKMLICATATERGTDNLHPFTTATATQNGWRIDGDKMFVTMSPVATHLAMNLRMQDDKGDHLATTMLPIGTKGIEPQGDWDALGMRGSGSQSIRFNNFQVDKSAVRRLAPWGKWSTDVLINRTLGNLPLVAAFLGIAEHAFEITMKSLATQKRVGEPVNRSAGVQQCVGEMEIELAKCRAVLNQSGLIVDAWLEKARSTPPTIEDAHELMKTYQSAKWIVNRGAIDIVDKAMDLVGGGGFMSAHPLSQLYRDVRAGPFMQPHAATDIRPYIGQVALGVYPEA